MISFNESEQNKQFVSIKSRAKSANRISDLYNLLSEEFKTIPGALYAMDQDEMIIAVKENYKFDFSLNQLRDAIPKKYKAVVRHFSVDMAEPGHRV